MPAPRLRFKQPSISLLPLIAVLLSLGCQPETTSKAAPSPSDQIAESKSSIAVIDLVRIAEGIGAAQKMREAVLSAERKLVNELLLGNPNVFANAAADSFAEFNKLATAKLDALDPDKKQALARDAQSAQVQLVQRQVELRQKFCNDVSGVAFDVAREQGFDMVLTTGQVFATTSDHDITAAVIERINRLNKDAPAPPASKPSTAKLPGGGSFPIR